MELIKVNQLISALKTEFSSTYGERISFEEFYKDQDELSLLIQEGPLNRLRCRTNEILQIQIIDSKEGNTTFKMKEHAEAIKTFLISKNKTFDGFETLHVLDTGDHALFKTPKGRYVYTLRFDLTY